MPRLHAFFPPSGCHPCCRRSDPLEGMPLGELPDLHWPALALAVSQPTVARHIRSLKTYLGLPLFERDRDKLGAP